MQNRYVIATVVVAVLATVAVEESRISKLRKEVIRLRQLPDARQPAAAATTTEDEAAPPNPAPATVDPGPEPAAPAATGRVPADFPEPDEARIRALAVGPNSALYYALNLNNHERAYLEHLLENRAQLEAKFAQTWMAASPDGRSAIEAAMRPEIGHIDAEIHDFLEHNSARATFAVFQEKQSERALAEELRPLLDQAGLSLDQEKESRLIDALHQARVATGSLRWDSIEALPVIAAGGAPEKFEQQWDARTELLAAALPEFLTEEETAAVLEARAQLKEPRLAGVRMAVEALGAAAGQ